MSANEPTAGGLFGRIAGRLGDDAAAGPSSAAAPSFSMADLVSLPAEEAALARFVLLVASVREAAPAQQRPRSSARAAAPT